MTDRTLTVGQRAAIGDEFIVRFALCTAPVRIVGRINYQQGPAYHVQDVVTGHQDYVGGEYLESCFAHSLLTGEEK
jgi:hypothetical protein